jgi:hypothetical protein
MQTSNPATLYARHEDRNACAPCNATNREPSSSTREECRFHAFSVPQSGF